MIFFNKTMLIKQEGWGGFMKFNERIDEVCRDVFEAPLDICLIMMFC
jgi:hypothetical protein